MCDPVRLEEESRRRKEWICSRARKGSMEGGTTPTFFPPTLTELACSKNRKKKRRGQLHLKELASGNADTHSFEESPELSSRLDLDRPVKERGREGEEPVGDLSADGEGSRGADSKDVEEDVVWDVDRSRKEREGSGELDGMEERRRRRKRGGQLDCLLRPRRRKPPRRVKMSSM